MSNIARLNFYKKQKCANCGYYWDYPFSNRSVMSPLQNLFYFELHYCPNCHSLGLDITTVGQFELQIQQDKQYKQIIKERNIPFGVAYKKESYKYVLYAYMCEINNDDLNASKAYYMANRVERYQKKKYIESMMYNEANDAKMLKESDEKQQKYLNSSIYYMEKFVQDNPNNIDAGIMLALLYKLAFMSSSAILQLNKLMKMQVNQTQIEMIKEVNSMELGVVGFCD